MDGKELRIGNFINFEQTTHQITSISKSYCDSLWSDGQDDNYTHSYENIKPIPLTEEWLLKFGFDMYYNPYSGTKTFTFDLMVISINVLGDFNFIFDNKELDINLKTAHRLQNLYFALTQKELIYEK